MKKESINTPKNTVLLATGNLTGFAFLQSLVKSKALVVMSIIGIILFGGLGLFLYKMAGA
jgi:hypothetical protein